MRAYIITSGAIFALLVAAHVWRVAIEGLSVARDPWFLGSTLIAVGLSAWAIRLVRQSQA
jgi:hypothetical protein